MEKEKEILTFKQWVEESYYIDSLPNNRDGQKQWVKAAKEMRSERMDLICLSLNIGKPTLMNWLNEKTFPNAIERKGIVEIAERDILFKVKDKRLILTTY